MFSVVLGAAVVDASFPTRAVGNGALGGRARGNRFHFGVVLLRFATCWLRWAREGVRMFLVVLGAAVVGAYRRLSFVAFTAALLSLALLYELKTRDPRANVAEEGRAGGPITCVLSFSTC